MKYKVDDYPFVEVEPGHSIYVTLDDLIVPICQEADEEQEYVCFAPIDEDRSPYFDYRAEDFVILRRTGKVKICIAPDREVADVVRTTNYIEAFPYEIPQTARPTGSHITCYKPKSK